jgi:hypothetical protein
MSFLSRSAQKRGLLRNKKDKSQIVKIHEKISYLPTKTELNSI